MDGNGITNELSSFSQTQSPRVKDPGVPVNANPPPPPPPSQRPQDEPSPHPFRGQNLNTVA
jgi:hypothetical protein